MIKIGYIIIIASMLIATLNLLFYEIIKTRDPIEQRIKDYNLWTINIGSDYSPNSHSV